MRECGHNFFVYAGGHARACRIAAYLYTARMHDASQIHPPVAGLILAAGASSRMGQPKLLLPLRGEPVIVHVLRAAAARDASGKPLLDPVLVVLGPHAPDALARHVSAAPRVRTVRAGDAAQGQAHSLRAGVASLVRQGQAVEGVCVLLGDQPFVDGRLLERLLQAFAAHPSAFVVPHYEGQRGNPVIIPRMFFPQVLALSGDTGARPLFRHPQAQIQAVEVDSDAVLLDMDTPEAYAALRARAEQLANVTALE